MDVVLGKWLFAAVQPSSMLLWLVVVGTLLAHRPVGRMVLVVAIGAVVLATFARLGDAAVAHLEQPWLAAPLPPRVAGIVVLGGGTVVRPALGEDARQAIVNEDVERLLAPLWLAAPYPDARLVFTGGGSGLWSGRPTEAAHVAWLWEQLGFQAGTTFESASWNTRDNAVNTFALVQPAPGEPWLLVTSAVHMRRAMATFERVGWNVHPYAVDIRGRDPSAWPSERWGWLTQFRQLDLAAREWLGLIVYRLRGWA